ncbi:MAG: hypothetical protein QXP66_00970 [Candidatus Aenigmatarchaeota archaeon]
MDDLDLYLLEKLAAKDKAAEGRLRAAIAKLRDLIRRRPLTAAALSVLGGAGIGAGTLYGLKRKSSLDDLLLDDYLGGVTEDEIIDELEKEAALDALLTELAIEELLG